MHRSIPVLIATTAIALPFAAAMSGPQVHAAAVKHTTKKAAPAKIVKYLGPSVNMQWGPVQVTILVQNKKVIKATATYPTERARSQYINSIAVPLLVQETLKAKNGHITQAVSGATMTSDAFYTSLEAALKMAKM